MIIEKSRNRALFSPLLPAVRTWIDNRYVSELANAGTSAWKRAQVASKYTGIYDKDIWVEKVRNPVSLSGQFLCCFSVLKKGFAVVDAKLPFVTFEMVKAYFQLSVTRVASYGELITLLKENPQNVLYQVGNKSRYGVVVNNRLSVKKRCQDIMTSLGGVDFNIVVDYNGKLFSESQPETGIVTLTSPGFTTTTLDVYPLEEIA